MKESWSRFLESVNLGEFIYRSEYVRKFPFVRKKFWLMAELGVNFAQLQLGLYAAWLSLAVKASGRLPVETSMLERGSANSISIIFYEMKLTGRNWFFVWMWIPSTIIMFQLGSLKLIVYTCILQYSLVLV